MSGEILPGRWKLCYCLADFAGSNGCIFGENFKIELGYLRVLGPFSAQDSSCSMDSSSCLIGPVIGEGLSAQDLILLVPAMPGMSCENSSSYEFDVSNISGLILEVHELATGDSPIFALPNASSRTQLLGT